MHETVFCCSKTFDQRKSDSEHRNRTILKKCPAKFASKPTRIEAQTQINFETHFPDSLFDKLELLPDV